MDNIEKLKQDIKDIELLNGLGEGFTKLLNDASEKDPLSMTDAEFNNLCNLVTIHKAQINLIKESIATAEDTLNAIDMVLQLAKIVRGGSTC